MSKPILSHSFVAAIGVMALSIPMAAVAQGTSTTDQNVGAFFFVDGPEGCLITQVFATQIVQARPKPSTIQNFSSMQIDRDIDGNSCATISAAGSWNPVNIAVGGTDQPPAQFTVDQRLTSATLKVTIPIVFAETGVEKSVVVDLIWTGNVGQLSVARNQPEIQSHPVAIVHASGFHRSATVFGTVFDGTTDWAVNSISSPPLVAWIDVQTRRVGGAQGRLFH